MKDVKRVLLQVKHSQKFTYLTQKTKYRTTVTSLNINLNNLDQYILKKEEVKQKEVIGSPDTNL